MKEEEDNYIDEDNEILDCPACGQTYDDADADFLICSRCGWNEDQKKYDRRKISRSLLDDCGAIKPEMI